MDFESEFINKLAENTEITARDYTEFDDSVINASKHIYNKVLYKLLAALNENTCNHIEIDLGQITTDYLKIEQGLSRMSAYEKFWKTYRLILLKALDNCDIIKEVEPCLQNDWEKTEPDAAHQLPRFNWSSVNDKCGMLDAAKYLAVSASRTKEVLRFSTKRTSSVYMMPYIVKYGEPCQSLMLYFDWSALRMTMRRDAVDKAVKKMLIK